MIMYMGYLPSYVRYHNGLSVKEKLLYCELTAMANANGIAKIDKEHLGVILEVSGGRVRTMLNNLIKYKLIDELGKEFITFGTEIKDVVTAFETSQTEGDKTDNVTRVAEDLVNSWNAHFGTKFRATSAVKQMVRARLKSFKEEELHQALENRIFDVENNPWYQEPENQKYIQLMELAIRDDKRTEKYVNFVRKAAKIDFGKQTIAAKVVTNKKILE